MGSIAGVAVRFGRFAVIHTWRARPLHPTLSVELHLGAEKILPFSMRRMVDLCQGPVVVVF